MRVAAFDKTSELLVRAVLLKNCAKLLARQT